MELLLILAAILVACHTIFVIFGRYRGNRRSQFILIAAAAFGAGVVLAVEAVVR